MGDDQEIFIAFELTKFHETHYRGTVKKVLDELQQIREDGKLKGEITLVIAPGEDKEAKVASEAKGMGFDVSRDSEIKVDILQMCRTLESKVEMSEHELRMLMKSLFPSVPSYHINAVSRMAKKGKQESRMEGLLRRSGGIDF